MIGFFCNVEKQQHLLCYFALKTVFYVAPRSWSNAVLTHKLTVLTHFAKKKKNPAIHNSANLVQYPINNLNTYTDYLFKMNK